MLPPVLQSRGGAYETWGVGLIAALGLAALPAVASARTQTVYAGGTPAFQKQLQKQFGEALAFFPGTVKINAGDSIAWVGLGINFHSIDLPSKGGPLPLILPHTTITPTLNDAAGSPFWFSNKVPILGFNPALLAPSGGKTSAAGRASTPGSRSGRRSRSR